MTRELVVQMPREIDHHQAKEIGSALDYKISVQGVRTLVFDFAQTEFMDSSGIGIVIGRSKTMKYYQGEVVARNMGCRVKRILLAAGMDKLITMENASDASTSQEVEEA